MTPSERLRAQAAELLRLADELDDASDGAPARPARGDLIDTGRARRIADASHSTITRWCRRFGIGYQLESGQWRVSRRALLAFLEARGRGEIGDFGDGPGLP